jgi:hypothetical protein
MRQLEGETTQHNAGNCIVLSGIARSKSDNDGNCIV